ncbi:MAG: hypothetical protein JNL42_20930 [Anaerolineae bacterium]|nr:hypothetical protein [Anaerolineae bacterium]
MVNESHLASTAGARKEDSSGKLRRNVILGMAGLVAVLTVLFIAMLLLSIVGGESFAGAVRTIRDLVIIFLVLEGILIILALTILVLQVSRLVNLLQTEVKPMLDTTQSTLSTVRGTVDFMSENLTQPIVRASGFLTGFSVLTSNLFGIRRALRHANGEKSQDAQ